MKISQTQNNTGFTLIEIMVAMSIFMIVLLMGLGALITSSSAAKKAQAMHTALDSVNFAVESMTRYLRQGSDYYCYEGEDTPPIPAPVISYGYHDCPTGGYSIVFTPADKDGISYPHPPGSRDTAYYRLTRFSAAGLDDFGIGKFSPYGGYADIISRNVFIDKLRFFVKGSDPNDGIQPSVTILIKGTVTVGTDKIPFSIQTMVSQRAEE